MSKHYKKQLKDGSSLESIDFIQSVMGEYFQYGCWFNILKYPVRAYDKHKTPIADIKKTMHYCLFLLNDLHGKQATFNQEKLFDIFACLEIKPKSRFRNIINKIFRRTA